MTQSHRQFIHQMRISVRWGDMDALGHLNNTVYFRLMEQARIDWMEKLELPIIDKGQGVIIVSANCHFKLPIVYPATVQIDIFANPPGRSSIHQEYELRDAENPDKLYAVGSSTLVWIDHHMGKSIPLPEKIRALFPE